MYYGDVLLGGWSVYWYYLCVQLGMHISCRIPLVGFCSIVGSTMGRTIACFPVLKSMVKRGSFLNDESQLSDASPSLSHLLKERERTTSKDTYSLPAVLSQHQSPFPSNKKTWLGQVPIPKAPQRGLSNAPCHAPYSSTTRSAAKV